MYIFHPEMHESVCFFVKMTIMTEEWAFFAYKLHINVNVCEYLF